MWIWFTVSLLLVIASIIFGVYSFIGSRTLQKAMSTHKGLNTSSSHLLTSDLSVLQQQAILNLKTKLKSIEENSLVSAHHLTDLKNRVELLETSNDLKSENEEAKKFDSEEDWEKMYYETKREKQSLEDNLNYANDALQQSNNNLQEFKKQQADQAAMKIDLESKLSEIHSLQGIIHKLEIKLESAAKNERELEEQIAYEKSRHIEYELMQKEIARLQSEIDILTNTLRETNDNNRAMEQKVKSLIELGSILEISEYEKTGIKNKFEQMLQKM